MNRPGGRLQQFHDALSILHDTLAADSRTANVKIILPEEIHWNNLDLVSQVMSDPVESNYTNLIYADHTYGINTIAGGKDGFAPISGLNGHQIWETEHTGDDPGLGITAGLNEAQSIYDIVYVCPSQCLSPLVDQRHGRRRPVKRQMADN